MPTLTIFTPTYNRAHTLGRVFESLERQTCHDFVWLVIDDGSTDSTRELVERWQQSAAFPVDYVYQPNGGKHTAHNAAVARATTDLFTILDSDDELLPHAAERITGAWMRMTASERSSIAGIWTLCTDPTGKIIGTEFPDEVFDSSLQELHYSRNINQEMLPTFTTEVLRSHPFPRTPPGACAYIPESYVWMRITRTRPLRFLNVACRIYHQGDGLSVTAANEYRLSHCIVFGYLAPLAHDLPWFWRAPLSFVMTAVQAARYGIFSGRFWSHLTLLAWPARALMLTAAPLALALILKDRLNGRIAGQLAPDTATSGLGRKPQSLTRN